MISVTWSATPKNLLFQGSRVGGGRDRNHLGRHAQGAAAFNLSSAPTWSRMRSIMMLTCSMSVEATTKNVSIGAAASPGVEEPDPCPRRCTGAGVPDTSGRFLSSFRVTTWTAESVPRAPAQRFPQMSVVSDHRKQELGQGIERQGERECATASGFAGNPHPSAMESDNFLGNVETQTEAGSGYRPPRRGPGRDVQKPAEASPRECLGRCR